MITLLMKKYTKLFALMGFALLAGACQNDNLIPEAPALPGDEIVFGATAYFENGEPQTRTVYGDIAGDNIEVRWVPNKDYIDIACPEAVGSQNSEYMVSGTTSGETGSGVADDYSASVLVRQSPVGLQWSTAGIHNFYATYPSAEQIRKDVGVSLTDAEKSALGMKLENNNAILTGYLPVDQSPINIPTTTKTVNGMTGYVVEPNMTYAYMVAQESVKTRGNVGLTFSSQVTALEFQIVAGAITGENPQGLKDITILGVQLYSKSGQNIAGHFTYDFETGNFNDTNQKTGYEKVTQTFGDGLTISANTGFISTTFFLSPNVDFTLTGDLRLTVIYKIGNSPMVKTATFNKKDIVAKKKYFFKNVKLPAHDASVSASAWFSALNPATWISQVSIPVAANAFTSYYSGTDSKFIKQQVKNYEELWNMGVRGFEFMTSASNTSTNLGTEKFVANGAEITTTGAPDFNTAFRTLYAHLKKNPGETLVIVATYKSYGGDTHNTYYPKYNHQTYITHLENYLTSFWEEVQADYEGNKENLFVKLGTNSRVADLRNKIAIVIRPGDDEYNQMVNGNDATYTVSSAWINHVALIKNWGTGVDQWDKRYGSDYYAEGVYGSTASKKIETNIPYIASTSATSISQYNVQNMFSGNFDTFNNYKDNKITGYSLDVDGGGEAYMQCWERVSPFEDYIYTGLNDTYMSDRYNPLKNVRLYLWVKWKQSLNEKKLMIADVLAESRATKGNTESSTIFINSLASYFITTELHESTYPYNTEVNLGRNYFLDIGSVTDCILKYDNAGKGGDWASCAAELNYLMWSELNAPEAEGPMGLVVLNYIGAEPSDFNGITPISMAVTGNTASQASKELPLKIMLNNFIFPLSTDENYKDPDEDPEPPKEPETQDPDGDEGEA